MPETFGMHVSQRAIRKMIESVDGLSVVDLSVGKHYRATVRTPNGRTHLFFMSMTPSCPFVEKRQKAQLRKLLRDNPAGGAAVPIARCGTRA